MLKAATTCPSIVKGLNCCPRSCGSRCITQDAAAARRWSAALNAEGGEPSVGQVGGLPSAAAAQIQASLAVPKREPRPPRSPEPLGLSAAHPPDRRQLTRLCSRRRPSARVAPRAATITQPCKDGPQNGRSRQARGGNREEGDRPHVTDCPEELPLSHEVYEQGITWTVPRRSLSTRTRRPRSPRTVRLYHEILGACTRTRGLRTAFRMRSLIDCLGASAAAAQSRAT